MSRGTATMLLSRRIPAIGALYVLSSCSPTTFDAAAESAKLLKRDAEWAYVAQAGKDIDKIVSYWSDDAIVIPQGQPAIEGKSALRSYVANSLHTPGFSIHWVSEKVDFSPDGKLAYMRSTNELTVPRPNGAPMKLPGRAITIWRLEPDGEWRCVVDIWNDAPATVVPSPLPPTR